MTDFNINTPVSSCPPNSVLDKQNILDSPNPIEKPCHCVNQDGSYNKKWIHMDGSC